MDAVEFLKTLSRMCNLALSAKRRSGLRRWIDMAMKIGYIMVYDLEMNPHLTERFKFLEATFTRRITSKGDRVYSKMLQFPVDYEEIVENANIMKKNPQLILTREPFLLDDELKAKVTKWVEWANKVDQSEYDPFVKQEDEE